MRVCSAYLLQTESGLAKRAAKGRQTSRSILPKTVPSRLCWFASPAGLGEAAAALEHRPTWRHLRNAFSFLLLQWLVSARRGEVRSGEERRGGAERSRHLPKQRWRGNTRRVAQIRERTGEWEREVERERDKERDREGESEGGPVERASKRRSFHTGRNQLSIKEAAPLGHVSSGFHPLTKNVHILILPQFPFCFVHRFWFKGNYRTYANPDYIFKAVFVWADWPSIMLFPTKTSIYLIFVNIKYLVYCKRLHTMFCSFIVVIFFSEFRQRKGFRFILQDIFTQVGATKFHTLHFEFELYASVCEYGMDCRDQTLASVGLSLSETSILVSLHKKKTWTLFSKLQCRKRWTHMRASSTNAATLSSVHHYLCISSQPPDSWKTLPFPSRERWQTLWK